MTVVFEAHEIYRFFHADDEETFALRGVSLQVAEGEMVAIVGPSGSGKSTLLSCLAGLDEPSGGYVTVAGTRITRRAEDVRSSLRASSIGMLLQSANLFDHLTLDDNIRAAQALAGKPQRSPSSLLADVGLDGRGGSYPTALSGGESARAGLAVALANDPPVLLADEPTAEVDAGTEAVLLELLRARTKAGAAAMVVTHSARVAAAADRVVHLVDGKIVDG